MLRLFIVAALLIAVLTVSATAAVNTIEIRTLKVLIPIYRGAPDDPNRLSDDDLTAVINGCKLGRLFYFRNTYGKLNIDQTFLVIDESAPDNTGPSYDNIEADLRARGIEDGQYDGVFTTGIGLQGNWGGFHIFRRTGGALGGADRRGGLTWYPEDRPDVWYGAAWNFVHEFQHALDSPIASGSGHPEFLHGHPYADCMEGYFTWGHKAAQHWDWEAHTLRYFTSYETIHGVTDTVIIAIDTDGDGLADDDPRLPMDEKRFGSDPTKKDTDGDGLDDLAEFCADIFRGSDPNNPDTDGDGIPDGLDRNPTVALAETVSYSAVDPVIDGAMDSALYKPLSTSPYVQNSAELASAGIYACWNEDALFLFVKSDVKCNLHLLIDTSAENGFWEGGDTYAIKVSPDGKIVFTDLGLSGEVPGSAVWGADGLEIKLPALIGQGASNEINWGGARRKADTTDGMALLEGQLIGLNLAISNDSGRVLFTPNWSMFDTVLEKPDNAPARPSLRFSETLTRDSQPSVFVTGVGSQTRVEVIDEKGTLLGERQGSGPVFLTGAVKVGEDKATGANVIRARAAGVVSDAVTLVIDRGAAAPKASLSAGGESCLISGEPGATADVYIGTGMSPVSVVGSVTLDANGEGKCDLPMGSGFLGGYGLETNFDSPLFARIDQKIEFDYRDGPCDPRLPNDGFCIRWTGYLQVEKAGDYTFYLTTDDGSRMWVNGMQVIDNWGHHGPIEKTATVSFAQGEHEIRVDYYEEYGWASAHLEWSGPSIERTHDIPVRPLSSTAGKPVFFVRQTDPVGNVSEFTKL